MRRYTLRYYGGAFWLVYDQPTAVGVETRLWFLDPRDLKHAEHPAATSGFRNISCSGCGSDSFLRTEIVFTTDDELVGRECLAAEMGELKKLLADWPGQLPSDFKADVCEYVSETDKATERIGKLCTQVPASGSAAVELLERANAEHLFQAAVSLGGEALQSKIEAAKADMVRQFSQGIWPELRGSQRGILDLNTTPRFVRLTCKDCGRWTTVMPYGSFGVPDEWWVNPEVPEPDVVRVEFDHELLRPLACVLDGVPVEIVQTRTFVRSSHPLYLLDRPTAAGIYEVETDIGDLTLEAVPVQSENGEPDWTECAWKAQFRSERAARRWREMRRTGIGIRRAVLSVAEARVRLSETRNLNSRAYEVIYDVESQLRLRLEKAVERKYRPGHGARWWTVALDRFLEYAERHKGAEPESAAEVLNYLTWPQLGEVIEHRWDALKHVFPREKSRLKGWFKEMEDIRNDVAHNRPLERKKFEHLVMVADLFRGVLEEGRRQE